MFKGGLSESWALSPAPELEVSMPGERPDVTFEDQYGLVAFTQSEVAIEVKPVFPKGIKLHCCEQGTLFPNQNIANGSHGLPLETHAVG